VLGGRAAARFERTLERVRAETAIAGVPASRWGRHKADRVRTWISIADGKPLMANVNLSLSGRQRASGWPPVRGRARSSVPSPESGRSVAARSRVAEGPGPLSSAATVSAGRHAPQRGELSHGGRWCGRRDAREALEAVGLAELAGRLDEAGHWALQLSPGEQQRIAFVRALVQKPDWLFLDEATRRWTRPRRGASIGWCASGSRDDRVQRWPSGDPAPFHARRLECSPPTAVPPPWWK